MSLVTVLTPFKVKRLEFCPLLIKLDLGELFRTGERMP